MDNVATSSLVEGRERTRSSSRARAVSKRDYAVGIALLLTVVVLWTASSFVTQDLFDGGYTKPFLVTYLNTSAFAIYLIPYVIQNAWRQGQTTQVAGTERGRARRAEYQPLATTADGETSPEREDNRPTKPAVAVNVAAAYDERPLTWQETARLAFAFCLLWFVANWTVNAALEYTSVASATVLSSMSGMFTLAIGRLFKVEILTAAKFVAVATSFFGVLLVSMSDSSASTPSIASARIPKPFWGDTLALLSALFYALYVILLKVRIRDESRINMQLFFGFVGLFNILLLWPLGVLLHLTGVERFALPGTRKEVAALLINMFITLSSDYIYVIAMLKTTPLVVTVGLSLTIPIAVIGDFFLHVPASARVLFGSTMILLSFGLVGLSEREPALRDHHPLVDEGGPAADVQVSD